uniref:hypothetical protein n=1 Tax=uncultured Sphingomonas sp. TaxID=158754 RepID=UPI0025D0B3FE|nr:hypothetical protein [uncultured Sphingomonas sp.]
MDAYRGAGAHPHHVEIPDPARTDGVRAYREPEQPHPLQLRLLEAEDEQAWAEELRTLLAAGRTDAAAARLAAELDGFEGKLARLCRATGPEQVTLRGWDDLLAYLAEWEGPPVTAITLGLTNPPDLVFEPGREHEPEVLLSVYSDDAYPFSTVPAETLLAECAAEAPAWIGHEEDVELYCELAGLAGLNTALIHCKHRHFLRDGRDGVTGRAPGGYVEYRLGCWRRTAHFLQAVQGAVAEHGLPRNCRLIVGAVGVDADFVTILEPPRRRISAADRSATASAPAFAALTIKPWTPREEPADPGPASGTNLRQRLAPGTPAEPAPSSAEPRRNWFARLFGRRGS